MPDRPTYRHLLRRYANYASNYDRRFARYSRETLRHALRVIPLHETRTLLDVACGTGLLAEMLLLARPQLRITGVDVSPDMLNRARQRIPSGVAHDVEWKQAFAEELPLPAATFDVVTCTNAFHLVQNAESALQEFHRVLKPGGELVIVDWCRDFAVMRVRDSILQVIDRQRRSIRTIDELSRLIDAAGFQVTLRERFTAERGWGLMCVTATAGNPKPKTQQMIDLKPARVADALAPSRPAAIGGID